jgi:hypothetical protein
VRKDKAAYIAGIRASVFENLTFLRMRIFAELDFAEWCTFLTRRVTMQIQMAMDDPKAYAERKGSYYCFFNKFSNGTKVTSKKVQKLTKAVLHGHLARLPQSV